MYLSYKFEQNHNHAHGHDHGHDHGRGSDRGHTNSNGHDHYHPDHVCGPECEYNEEGRSEENQAAVESIFEYLGTTPFNGQGFDDSVIIQDSFTARVSVSPVIDIFARGYGFEDSFAQAQTGFDNSMLPQFMDGDDFAGDSSTTGVITVGGGNSSGTLEVNGDDDWFAFTVEAGEFIDVFLRGTGGAGELGDPFLRIYDAEGNLVAMNDDIDLGRILDSRLTFLAEEGGTYFASVRAYADSDSGDYLISADVGQPPQLLESLQTPFVEPGTPNNSDTTLIQVYFEPAQASRLTVGSGADRRDIDAVEWTSYEIQQTLLSLNEISNFINVEFVQTNDAAAADFKLIVENNTAEPGALAFFFFPTGGTNDGVGVFNRAGVGWDEDGSGGLERGGFGYTTLIHEFGHGFGLEHPHDGDVLLGVGGNPQTDRGLFDLNQSVFTVMSYVDGWAAGPLGESFSNGFGYQATFAPLDLAILQDVYGANETFNNGDNVYTLFGNNAVGEALYETIWDTGGIDTLQAGNMDLQANINLQAATLQYEEGGGGFVSHSTSIFGGFTIANGVVIENAIGSNVGDEIVGNDANNRLEGLDGDDMFFGGLGDDIILGGNGSDTVVVASTNQDEYRVTDNGDGTFTITHLNDTDATEGSDILSGIEFIQFGGTNGISRAITDLVGVDQVIDGDDSNNVLIGSSANDTINGFGGNDRITGAGGDDLIDAGSGNDTIIGGVGRDSVNGGIGFDTIRFEASQNGGVTLNFLTGTGSGGDAEGDSYVSIERAIGTRLADDLIGSNAADVLFGRGGRDELFGNDGNDTLFGEFGRDEITGGAGNDILNGGESNDTFFAGLGADSHDGGSGIRDTVDYRGSTGIIVNLETGQGAGGWAEGDIYTNVERIIGSFRNDTITGSEGRDFLNSVSGDDILDGQGGNDRLSGGGGNDMLNGGLGNDVLIGGGGADTFIFMTAEGNDIISDFTNGTDMIDFSDFDAFNDFDDVMASAVQDGTDVLLTVDGDSSIRLSNLTLTDLDVTDFIF